MIPKTIHLIRHAQAEHNVNFDNFSFPDAQLTQVGKEQCTTSLHPRTEHSVQRTAQLLVSSPLRRTLQTALLGLPALIARLGGRGAVVVLPQLQENGASPADTGSSRAELEKIAEFAGFDLSALDDEWNSKTGFWASDEQSLRTRAAWTRQWLARRPENEIVVVSHGGALRYLTGDYAPHPDNLWENTECRTYHLIQETNPDGSPPNFKLVPVPSSSTEEPPLKI